MNKVFKAAKNVVENGGTWILGMFLPVAVVLMALGFAAYSGAPTAYGRVSGMWFDCFVGAAIFFLGGVATFTAVFVSEYRDL